MEYQLAECKKYLEGCGYELVEVYIDEAKSGKKTAGRDAFDSMMLGAAQKKFDKIIVFSFSRSFRNTRDALNYNHELMEKHGIAIESVIERIDLSDPHGKFSGTNLFAMHELQSDITAAHAKAGMYFAAQQGYFLGGFVPFGYELYGTGEFTRGKERKKYRPNPAEVGIVREMFELYADGFSLDFVQTAMRQKGIKGRKGDIISKQTIARILKNAFYIGTREYSVKGYEPLSIENAVPAIIDADTWAKVQARHVANKPVQPRRTKRLYSLTGKITCAKCGGHMFGTYKGDKRSDNWSYAYYHCANKKGKGTCDALNVRKNQIDAYVLREIKQHILNEDAMRAIATQISAAAGNSSEDMQAALGKAEKRKEKIAGILKNIKRDQYEGEITKEMAAEMSAEYERELLELENTLSGLKNAVSSAITPEGVYLYLQELLSLYSANNDELTKVLFDKVIEKIVVHDDRIELFLVVFPFAALGDSKPSGHPHYSLSLEVARKDIKTINV